MSHVLVTGANGFVGKALCAQLIAKGCSVSSVSRSTHLSAETATMKHVIIDDINDTTDWCKALTAVDVVVHLAARVHIMADKATDPLAAFRQVNVAGTLNLARQAAHAGVKRFVFISSIKVNGETTVNNQAFTAEDEPAPLDAYAISKREAEDGLQLLAAATGMEIVIIRPPLVYGAGVKANFHILMRYVAKGVPLPFGNITNQRSLVALDNLVDIIIVCLEHPAAANQVFLVSDGNALSTTELVQRLATALGKKYWLLPLPMNGLILMLQLLGQISLAQRLYGNLQVDITKTCQLLDWTPPVCVDDALYQTAQYYLLSR